MPTTDDIARLVAIMVRQHQGQRAAALRRAVFGDSPDGYSRTAKACGVSPLVVQAWEEGAAKPTTQEGLAWLTYLYDIQPPPPEAEHNARLRRDAAESAGHPVDLEARGPGGWAPGEGPAPS
jgi:hypothetical protein